MTLTMNFKEFKSIFTNAVSYEGFLRDASLESVYEYCKNFENLNYSEVLNILNSLEIVEDDQDNFVTLR